MQTWSYLLRRRGLWLLTLPLGLMIWSAQAANAFDIAIGNEQSGTYRLGIGISSLVKIKLLPSFGIDLQPLITEDDEASLEALQNGLADFALVTVERAQPLSSVSMEAVANLGKVNQLTTMLVTQNGVDDASVIRILDTIFENVDFLATIDPDLQSLDPDNAVMGLTLPLHSGAKQFHADRWSSGDNAPVEQGASTATATAIPEDDAAATLPAESEEGAADARNYVLYFGFDDAELNREARATLERAASFAASLGTPAIIVAAYTDSVGDADYNYLLAERRAASVVRGLEALEVRYGRIDLSLFGERSPWAVTLDDVNEASNRRVELFIEEPVSEVQPLPIPAGYNRESEADADALSISPDYVPARPSPSQLDEKKGVKPLPRKSMM